MKINLYGLMLLSFVLLSCNENSVKDTTNSRLQNELTIVKASIPIHEDDLRQIEDYLLKQNFETTLSTSLLYAQVDEIDDPTIQEMLHYAALLENSGFDQSRVPASFKHAQFIRQKFDFNFFNEPKGVFEICVSSKASNICERLHQLNKQEDSAYSILDSSLADWTIVAHYRKFE